MITQKINEMQNAQEPLPMGSAYTKEVEKKVVEQVSLQASKKENAEVRAAINEATKEDTKVNPEKMKELIKKINESLKNLGVRLELSLDKDNGAMVRVFNEITNRPVATIPFQLLLSKISTGSQGNTAAVQSDSSAGDVSDNRGLTQGNINIII